MIFFFHISNICSIDCKHRVTRDLTEICLRYVQHILKTYLTYFSNQLGFCKVRINIPCIMVHSAYILLVCVYILMLIIGMYWAIIRWKKHRKYKIPGRIIDWVSFVSEESNYIILKIKLVKSTNVKEPRINDRYKLKITPDNILKIKLIKNLDANKSSLLDYNFGFSSNNNLKIQKN